MSYQFPLANSTAAAALFATGCRVWKDSPFIASPRVIYELGKAGSMSQMLLVFLRRSDSWLVDLTKIMTRPANLFTAASSLSAHGCSYVLHC